MQGRYGGLSDDMVKGLSAGFGFFIALIVLICLVWYCCCAEKRDNENDRGGNRTSSKIEPQPRQKHSNGRSVKRADSRQGRRLFS